MFLPVLLVLWGGCEKPPQALLTFAQEVYKRVEQTAAKRYARDELSAAEATLQDGWMELAHQNGRLAPLRNYHNADSLLRHSIRLAERAEELGSQRWNAHKQTAEERCLTLTEELTQWREALNGSLVLYRAEKHWKESELALETARRLIKTGEFESALEEASRSEKSLRLLSDFLHSYEDDENGKAAVWNQWARALLQKSCDEGDYALLVDKSAHKLYLIKSGVMLKSYRCDLGYNSAHQKLFAGDGATPEGNYKITSLKKGNSKYYKALLLDYPNEDDKIRFAENKRRGIISKRAGIGRLIEIHGHGGQGKDWTDGCVALPDEQMDDLITYMKIGCPVTIVRKTEVVK